MGVDGKVYHRSIKVTIPQKLFELLRNECNDKKLRRNRVVAESLYDRYVSKGLMSDTKFSDLYFFKGDRK